MSNIWLKREEKKKLTFGMRENSQGRAYAQLVGPGKTQRGWM